MTHEEQLGWERRAARPAAAAAFLSALLGLAGLALGASTLRPAPEDAIEEALLIHENPGATLGSAVLGALSYALLAAVLVYLYRATRYRYPQIPRPAYYLAIAGPITIAALVVVTRVNRINLSHDVADLAPLPGGKEGRKLAEDTLNGGATAAINGITFVCLIALVAAVVIISLNARRAGLLSSFMSILGVIVGVLMILPLLGPPIVQYFWVTALGLLFLDRLPANRERGPAWDSGEPDPWPTAAEVRAQALGEAPPPDRGEPEDEADDDERYEDEPEPVGTPHPRSKKRKRKRRR